MLTRMRQFLERILVKQPENLRSLLELYQLRMRS